MESKEINLIQKYVRLTDGNTYDRNVERSMEIGKDYCICCGKAIKDRLNAHEVTMFNGGTYIGEVNDKFTDDTVNDPGYMGAWYIGPKCYKSIRRNWRRFANEVAVQMATDYSGREFDSFPQAEPEAPKPAPAPRKRKSKLTKAEIAEICELQERLDSLMNQIRENGHDKDLKLNEGTIADNLEGAACNLECILQEVL